MSWYSPYQETNIPPWIGRAEWQVVTRWRLLTVVASAETRSLQMPIGEYPSEFRRLPCRKGIASGVAAIYLRAAEPDGRGRRDSTSTNS